MIQVGVTRLKIIFIIIAIIVIVIVIQNINYARRIKKDDPAFILQLIKQKAVDKTIGVIMQYNDERVVTINEHEPLPLASTSKVMIAVTYAELAAKGDIDPQTRISLEEIERYNVPKTDGGAFNRWLSTLNTEDNKVTLQEIVSGMIAEGANANADFLMTYIGLDRINSTIKNLGMEHHEPIYPFLSSMYIAEHFRSLENLDLPAAFTKIEEMSIEEYREKALAIHDQWKVNPLTDHEKKSFLKTANLYMQKLWSERLPKATADEYTILMQKINSKNYFSKEVHEHLDPIMEHMMVHPENQELFEYAGQKAGLTSQVVTLAMYAKDKQNNRFEFVFFANKLTAFERAKVGQNINLFQRKFIKDESFRKHVIQTLAND